MLKTRLQTQQRYSTSGARSRVCGAWSGGSVCPFGHCSHRGATRRAVARSTAPHRAGPRSETASWYWKDRRIGVKLEGIQPQRPMSRHCLDSLQGISLIAQLQKWPKLLLAFLVSLIAWMNVIRKPVLQANVLSRVFYQRRRDRIYAPSRLRAFARSVRAQTTLADPLRTSDKTTRVL